MEKNMEQIYREEFPHGSHTVYAEYGLNGDLTLSSHHYGSDVEAFWGNDEYEYYLIIEKDNVPKFMLEILVKVFNSEKKLTFNDLKDTCDEKGIKYSTHTYV